MWQSNFSYVLLTLSPCVLSQKYLHVADLDLGLGLKTSALASLFWRRSSTLITIPWHSGSQQKAAESHNVPAEPLRGYSYSPTVLPPRSGEYRWVRLIRLMGIYPTQHNRDRPTQSVDERGPCVTGRTCSLWEPEPSPSGSGRNRHINFVKSQPSDHASDRQLLLLTACTHCLANRHRLGLQYCLGVFLH